MIRFWGYSGLKFNVWQALQARQTSQTSIFEDKNTWRSWDYVFDNKIEQSLKIDIAKINEKKGFDNITGVGGQFGGVSLFGL